MLLTDKVEDKEKFEWLIDNKMRWFELKLSNLI